MTFTKSMKVMQSLFGKDSLFALATTKANIPTVRVVDAYYEEGSFYIVANRLSRKVIDIIENPNVALCEEMYQFQGKAYNIGHPLQEENKEIRETLVKQFEKWYFLHNNEADENMCYIKVELTNGFFYLDGTGYRVDFTNQTAEEFPFQFEAVSHDL